MATATAAAAARATATAAAARKAAREIGLWELARTAGALATTTEHAPSGLDQKRPPKPTPEQLEEEEAAKKAQEEADAAAIEEAKKRAEEILQEKLKEFEAAEKTRTPV